MTLIDRIRAKCVEANPALADKCSAKICAECDKKQAVREIRLADVLLAMPPGIYLKTLGEQTRLVVDDRDGPYDRSEATYWDCSRDNLFEQSDETLEFIGKVLNV